MSAGEQRILAIMVLYKSAPEESSAFRSLRDLLALDSAAQQRFACLLYDNSPEPHRVPDSGFPCTYVHDGSNPGLARAYNTGLRRAAETGAQWLMLLDQDTVLTPEYMGELLAALDAHHADPRLTAIAPRLYGQGRVLSPHLSLTKYDEFPSHLHGLMTGFLYVFNSGALLRVADLQRIGGFDENFPLDYLDHATFHQLQAGGGRVFVLRAALPHELSLADPAGFSSPGFVRRYWPSMRAEHRYYRRYASKKELFWHYDRRIRTFLWLLYGREFQRAIDHFRGTLGH